MWRVALQVPGGHVAAFEHALDKDAVALSSFETAPGGPWCVEALFAARPGRAAIEARLALAAAALGCAAPHAEIAPVPDTDWLAVSRDSFPPIRAGRFHIHGSPLPPAGGSAIDIEIDAGPAFGSGEHQTTRGCLLVLDALAKRGHRVGRVLDMGCGSAILAIAAARLWGASVLAADVDPRSVRTASANVRRNGVARLVRATLGDGYRNPAVRRAAPYDLIVANILARPLIAMAPDLARCLAPRGIAVLSGLLGRQERAVLAAHRARGLVLRRRIVIDDWHTLVIARPRPGA